MTVTLPAEKLSDLQEARRHAENLSQYRQKHREVPSIDAEEMLELYTAIEQLEDSGVKTKPSGAETLVSSEYLELAKRRLEGNAPELNTDFFPLLPAPESAIVLTSAACNQGESES